MEIIQLLFVTLLCAIGCIASQAEESREGSPTVASNGVVMFDLGRADSVISDATQTRRYLSEEGPDSPLYRGFGTHFVYVYVGTPRQRVSVIVDTGSHHTAFPCSGCSQCGDHTDLYFNPKSSSTIVVPKCGGKNCVFSQSYTEGSMWTAYRVRDRFFIGGETKTMAVDAEKHDVEFTFGCQTKETGLFRTQMENGIMGLSADSKTLPNTLYQANMTNTNCFALCFLPTGGVMSLGGSHPHLKQGKMGYAQMMKKSGYFTVKVLAMFLRKADEVDLHELKVPMAKLNSGKGVIVDSGTTDTYLPSAISSAFQSLYKRLCGTSYTKAAFVISAEEVKKLPTVVFHLQKWDPSGKSAEFVRVEFPPIRYLEPSRKKDGKDMFVFRLYLTERSGGVLGANFMTGQNVEFDQKQQRVGFAPSHCKTSAGEPLYKGITKPVKLKKHRLRKLDDIGSSAIFSASDSASDSGTGLFSKKSNSRRRLSAVVAKPKLRPTGPCTAQCGGREVGANPSSSVSRVMGSMPAIEESSAPDKTYVDKEKNKLPGSSAPVGKIACAVACDAGSSQQVRLVNTSSSEQECPVLPWAMCGHDCMQAPLKSNFTALSSDAACGVIQTASRKCWRELCPFRPAVECAHRLRLSLPPFKAKRWNSLWKEDIIEALAKTLKVNPGKIDIPEPLQKKDTSVRAIVHIRVDKVSQKGKGEMVCPPLYGMSSTSISFSDIRNSFVEELHQLGSTVCGSWDWVREDNTLLGLDSQGIASRLGTVDE
mmetsp:Transcript_18651/g.31075  ORF Transcript_18651/g.31075 Transcript_18651/m.31075 type:complete len:762 (+) Transcript_18651:174-2459(+)